MRDNSAMIKSQSGNVFLFILLGIALFAALAFTISRSMQSTSVGKMSERQAKLAATDIINYAQTLERAVSKLRAKGISENNISFENSKVAGYDYAQPAESQIFSDQGGTVQWKSPPPDANNGSEWHFSGDSCVADLGNGADDCNTDTLNNEELIATLPGIDKMVCEEINKGLNIPSIPADVGSGVSPTKFQGVFGEDKIIDVGAPYSAACVSVGGSYYFYQVLLAR